MTEKNNHDLIENNELSANASGGTELMMRRIYDGFIPRELLQQFQIIPSRVRDLQEDKFRIYIVNDLPGDPEVTAVLQDQGWKKFHAIVFVSHWQAQRFIEMYGIAWSRCVVMQNAIKPITPDKARSKDDSQIKIIYHTTPHRGLNILLSVWDELTRRHPEVTLDVYSSFELYGWKQRDEEFKPLFDYCRDASNIIYYGAQSNEDVRAALSKADIFAYPSIWQETSCLCLMEAMSAGLVCVHPDFAALPETAANWTSMYRWHEDITEHAKIFLGMLDATVAEFKTTGSGLNSRINSQKAYADVFYNWDIRKMQWVGLLQQIVAQNPSKGFEAEEFVYRS
jgi:UDP-glucose:(glucosyl)LPS alpha-1,2-glucosyltransferase